MYGYSTQPHVYEDLSRYNVKIPTMPDGLSTAASVIAVIQIATSVACVGYEYLSSAKRAPECLRKLTAELKSLIEILTEIHICAQNHESRLLQRLDSPLQQCFADMINLQDKLRPRKKFGPLGKYTNQASVAF
jgi:hypothetical protein